MEELQEVNFFPNDPCGKELEWSMKCLFENGHDSIHCTDLVKNYDHCRNFWKWIQAVRRKEGVEPAMPPEEEWQQVKDKFLPMMKPATEPKPKLEGGDH